VQNNINVHELNFWNFSGDSEKSLSRLRAIGSKKSVVKAIIKAIKRIINQQVQYFFILNLSKSSFVSLSII